VLGKVSVQYTLRDGIPVFIFKTNTAISFEPCGTEIDPLVIVPKDFQIISPLFYLIGTIIGEPPIV
jgi:hypothetical protein